MVKDETVYQRMLQYIQTSELGVSRDTQFRAAKLLKVVLDGDEREIFEFSYRAMSERWEKLRTTLSMLRGRFRFRKFHLSSALVSNKSGDLLQVIFSFI